MFKRTEYILKVFKLKTYIFYKNAKKSKKKSRKRKATTQKER